MNYEEIVCDANNLYRAYKVSVKSSKWKESTQRFMMNFLRYIFEIQDDLINRTLQNGPTQEFELHERGRIRPITSITSCTEMMAGFYSVIFQNFMTTSFTRLRNENY
jgi:hypothetical protein